MGSVPLRHVMLAGVFVLSLLAHPSLSRAVNLVPNPGFETVLTCPDFSLEPFDGYVAEWFKATVGTPNFYHVCATDAQWGVPGGSLFSPLAYEGDGYAAVITYTTSVANYREYIEVELIAPLVAGVEYEVSFRVARALGGRYATDQLGAYFSVGMVGPSLPLTNLPFVPQIVSPVGVPIEVPDAWVEVSGSFVASGGETHLVIGNFSDDSGSTVSDAAPCSCVSQARYFVDAVVVEQKPPSGCVTCDADLNSSGTVDPADEAAMTACLGATPTVPSDPCFTSDVNCDEVVDSDDLDILQCQLGSPPSEVCCDCYELQATLPPDPTPTFSFDSHGYTTQTGLVPSFPPGATYFNTGAQILTTGPPGAPGPNPPNPTDTTVTPGIVRDQPMLGLMEIGYIEIDALSYGKDAAAECFDAGARLQFSADEFSDGTTGSLVESLGGTGSQEVAADVLDYQGEIVPTTLGPLLDATLAIDGSRMGLAEPSHPPSLVFGDDLDALDTETSPLDLLGPIYFSMDFWRSAPFHFYVDGAGMEGYEGADILVSDGGVVSLAIPAASLGLDLAGAGTDDLDALVFDDADTSGDLTPGDTLLFSVRLGSAVIGSLDSLLGLAIEPGDVLAPPTTPGATPQIFIPAERLGLRTVRTTGSTYGDELDALDVGFQVAPEPGGPAGLGLGAMLLLALRRQRRRREPHSEVLPSNPRNGPGPRSRDHRGRHTQ